MKLRKKRCCLISFALTFFLSVFCFGCGEPISNSEMQAVKTGYRIGYIQEEYYHMAIFAYQNKKPIPPVTSLRMPPFTTIEMFRYQIDCFIQKIYIKCIPRHIRMIRMK